MSRDRGWVDPYAGMHGRRLFVAVPLPAEAIVAITKMIDAVRAQGPPAGAHDVRWVRLDGLHLTLRFLGPTADSLVGPTIAAVERAAAGSPRIDAELGGTGTFPAGARPRALWLGVTAGSEALQSLAVRVTQELVVAGWPPDDRPFRAHLTLARSDGVAVGRLVADRLAAAMKDRRIAAPIERVGLFESVTGGGPARCVPVVEVPLAGPTPAGDPGPPPARESGPHSP